MEVKKLGIIFLVLILLLLLFSFLNNNINEGLNALPNNQNQSPSPSSAKPIIQDSKSNDLDVFKKNELSGSEKEEKQTVFKPNMDTLNPKPVVFEPGSFPFYEQSGYKPNYEDTVFISKTTNKSQVKAITDASYSSAGFCTEYANDPNKIEAACNSLDKNVCASTNCCILLGGKKCVAGDEKGPKISTNYSDFTIKDRDYYYYQGKCYGNCQQR
jgi:hypothetical protein